VKRRSSRGSRAQRNGAAPNRLAERFAGELVRGIEADPELAERLTPYVVGYGGVLSVSPIDIISAEINFVGNLVGTTTTWPS
jgi:hypothetical protein